MSREVAAPWYRWRGVVLGRPAGIDVIGAEPSLLDEGCCRLESLAAQWHRGDLAEVVAGCKPGVGGCTADTRLLTELAAVTATRLARSIGMTPGTAGVASGIGVASGAAGGGPGAGMTPGAGVVGSGAGVAAGAGGVAAGGCSGRAALAGIGLSGLAAALAVDLVVADLVEGGAVGVKVRVGGYRAMVGASPRHGGWSVPVPGTLDSPGGEVRLQRGAVATLHRPVRSSQLRAVTVVAGNAWRAHEIAMTAALRCGGVREAVLGGPREADRAVLGRAGDADLAVLGGAGDGQPPVDCLLGDDCAGARLGFADGRSITVGGWHQIWVPCARQRSAPDRIPATNALASAA